MTATTFQEQWCERQDPLQRRHYYRCAVRWIKEERGNVSANKISKCWENCFKEGVSRYSPATATSVQEILETAWRAAATEHSVSFTLFDIQNVLNPTDEDVVAEDISLDTLVESVVP